MGEELVTKLKSHIHWEEGMDDSMLSFYLDRAKKYVKNATDSEDEWIIIMIAGIMYEYRISEEELSKAIEAMTPFLIQEAVYHAQDNDEQAELES
ncbi:head-tail connector protein [Fervidibacillus albus]|uniref:Head-tail connector protein n=1 Tax=Fervidibacillus albus TaxID=2980026 RepID=A0A9E8LWN8_9BACI|nr:head-tail connector protein [Fervidibacillus albus]WAA10837.1 head-tail connector protein [Fervidibacillus albus]